MEVGVHWYGAGCASVRAESWTETLHCSEQCPKSPVVPLGPYCLSENGSGGCCLGRADEAEHKPAIHFLCPPPEPTAVVLGTVESTSLPRTCLWTYRALMQSRTASAEETGNTSLQTTQQSSGKHLSLDWVWIRGGIRSIVSHNPSDCPNSAEKIWCVIEWFTGKTLREKG